MYYKKALMFSVYLLILFSMGLFAVIYSIDPYMFFHKHWIYKNQTVSNLRIQNYGLMAYENFDSLIIGTSMLENTSADEATQKLGGNFANLSFPAATYYERYLMLRYVMQKKNIKHIITTLDFKFDEPRKTENTFINLYANDSIYQKFYSYFNTHTLLCVFVKKVCDLSPTNLDRPHAWFKYETHARRFGGFDNWLKYKDVDSQIQSSLRILNSEYTQDNINIKGYNEIIDHEIEPLFQNNSVQFDLIIPPYSMLWWAKSKEFIDMALLPYAYLIKKAEKYPNVRIYWFYDEKFVADIAVYKDLTHYHPDINSLQLDAIKNQTHLINMDNYQQKFADFKARVRKFDLDYYLNLIK